MKKQKKGISLIVLVITIIVMIILAAAIVISLNNANIINSANKAVSDTNLKSVKTAAELAYSKYIIQNKTVPDLGNQITEDLINDGTITGEDYVIKILNKQVFVIIKGSLAELYLDGTLKIGDFVAYDAGNNSQETDQYVLDANKNALINKVMVQSTSQMKWQVLGIDKETCNVLLVLTGVATPGNQGLSLTGVESYFNHKKILDDACQVFAKGAHAVKARSVAKEDIDNIANINYDYIRSEITIWLDEEMDTGFSYSIRYNTKIEHDGLTNKELYHLDENVDGKIVKSKFSYNFTSKWINLSEMMRETATYTNPSGYSVKYKMMFRNEANTTNVSYWVAGSSIGGSNYDIAYGVDQIYGVNDASNKYAYYASYAVWIGETNKYFNYDYSITKNIKPIVYIDASAKAVKNTVTNIWEFN